MYHYHLSACTPSTAVAACSGWLYPGDCAAVQQQHVPRRSLLWKNSCASDRTESRHRVIIINVFFFFFPENNNRQVPVHICRIKFFYFFFLDTLRFDIFFTRANFSTSLRKTIVIYLIRVHVGTLVRSWDAESSFKWHKIWVRCCRLTIEWKYDCKYMSHKSFYNAKSYGQIGL